MNDNLYDVGMKIMREERGLIGWAQHNSVMFEHGAIGQESPIVLGLDFMQPMEGHGIPRWDCALLDQAARQLIKHINENHRNR